MRLWNEMTEELPSFPPQKPLKNRVMKEFRLAQIIRIIGPAFRAA